MNNVYKKDKTYYFFTVFVLSILALLAYSIYIGNLKEGFHMDEMYSYGLSNSVHFSFPSRNNEWVNSDYFFEYVSVSLDERFAYESVINNQINDVHPPLYYLILHTVSSFFPNIFSKWIGIGVNITLYIGIYTLIVAFINKVIKKKWIALAGGLFWALSVGAASSIVFIRMYMLLTLISLILLYIIHAILIEEEWTFIHIVSLIGTLVAGSLTQYYFFIYSFFLVAVACILLLIKRRWLKSLYLGLFSLIGIVLSYLLFPAMLDHILLGNRGEEAVGNIVSGTEFNFFQLVSRDLFAGVMWIVLALLIIVSIYFRYLSKDTLTSGEKYSRQSTTLLILLPSICYLLFIQRLAPYQSERYILNIYPSICMTFVLFLYWTVSKHKKVKGSLFLYVTTIGTLIIIALAGLITQPINYLFEGNYEEVYGELDSYQDTDALVISSAFWKTNTNINLYLELDDIYRMHSVDGVFPELPEEDRLYSNDSLLLFLDSEFADKENIITLLDKYDFSSFQYLFTHDQSIVYYLN